MGRLVRVRWTGEASWGAGGWVVQCGSREESKRRGRRRRISSRGREPRVGVMDGGNAQMG